MRRRKALILSIILVLTAALGGHQVFGETMKIAYFNLPPHSMQQDGKHTGALITYWNDYVAPAMGVTLEWTGPLPPVRMLKDLEAGKINAIALLAKNEERLKLYDFPEKPFFHMNSGLALPRTHPLSEIKSADDMAGLKLGFFKKGLIPPIMQDPRIKWDKVTATDWLRQSLLKVDSSRLDAAFNPESYSLQYEVDRLNLTERIKVLIVPETSVGNFPLFSKKDKGHFLKKYMDAQTEVDKKIQYKDILATYLK